MVLSLNYIKAETEEKLYMLESAQVPKSEKTETEDLIKEREMRQRELEMEMVLHDKTSALGRAWRKGFQQGYEEGIQEVRTEMIEKMRKCGVPEEKINSIINFLNSQKQNIQPQNER